MNLKLKPSENPISGSIDLPGSKSISNRVLIIKALSGLLFNIQNLSNSDDTLHLLEALKSYSTSNFIDVGHAGTDMRFLTAFLTLKNGHYQLTGSERLQQRPIKDLVDVLKSLGADIDYKNNVGFPPLLIKGKQLDGGTVQIKGNVSSQFISALLLVAPYFTNGLVLEITSELVSKPYVIMTIEIMKSFGASINWVNNIITVKPVAYTYDKANYIVESDWSAASYFYSLIALSPDQTHLTLKGLFKNSIQADSACDVIYEKFGVQTTYNQNNIVITKTKHHQHSIINYHFIECPDIAQTVVCTCVALSIPFNFTGLQTLKVKETDRILALYLELKKIHVTLDITDDSIKQLNSELNIITPSVAIDTYNDHRMAMSFAPLSLVINDLMINNAEVVSKSYPMFWQHLNDIGIYQTHL